MRAFKHGTFMLAGLLVGLAFSAVTPVRGQAPDQAVMLLNSARKAFNEKSYPFAIARYREFLAKFGGHKEAPSARYGLALAVLANPPVNYQEARDLLQGLAGQKNLPEYPQVLYHLGLAQRGQGVQELAIADAKPQEANQRRDAARQRFDEARQQFALATAAFSAKANDDKDSAANLEWSARARCDQAEMELRVLKVKEARATTAGFMKDPVLVKSRYRDLGRYYHGFACFLLKDYPATEKTLSLLAPFADPLHGTHARYLLARTHHAADERAEAQTHYDGVLADFAKHQKDAVVLLQNPAKWQNDPAEKARLEELLKGPTPDHVQRARFYLGVLLYEGGKFGDARDRLVEFIKLDPKSPLRGEAELRIGFCHVQLKDFAEAIKLLTPLVDREKQLADQALLWLGKAQVGTAPDPQTNLAGYQKTLNAALAAYRQAAERAQQAGMDPEARERRGEILLEIADTQQQLNQFKDAAGTYNQLLNDKVLPRRDEEVLQRLITALHLAGDYNDSDKAVARFIEKHPQSPLLPAVMFRHAENSYYRLLAAEKNPNAAERAKELARLQDETIKRYQGIVEKYPEAPQINMARYSLGLTHYNKGDLEKARQALESIPIADRNAELAAAPYIMADCIIRLAPGATPEDALAAGKLEEQLKSAAELLEGFVEGQPKGPQAPDALIKLGYCRQRLAGLQGQPEERTKAYAAARAVYDRVLTQFPKDPLIGQALLERSKTQALSGDVNGAINELRKFTGDPWKKTEAAAMGLMELATLLRSQNRAAEAADTLAKARPEMEPELAKDSKRAGWVALLRYHHGLALREAGKLLEARAVFDQVVKQSSGTPEAMEAALRFAQCLKEEGEKKLEAARKIPAGTKKPEEIAAVQKLQADGFKSIADAVQFLESQAESLKKNADAQGPRARMHYEAAWGCRLLGERELEAARAAKVQEELKKRKPDQANLPPPEVVLKDVPVQPAEKKAWGHYRSLIADFADLPLSNDARFELAEMLTQRTLFDEALKLLNEALDKEPPAELTEKVRLRLGAVHAAKGDRKAALAQFNAVAANPKSNLIGQARYRAGECALNDKDYAEAIKWLIPFRDQPPLQNVPGVTDLALVRLGQAYAQTQNWEESRRAHERAANFPNTPFVDEARYGMGWALQQQKQYDQAVGVYSQVVNRSATETAAKAQLQIGLCRMEQKKYGDAAAALLAVPFTYDYPDLSAPALMEAARAFSEMKQNDQAIRLLERLLRDYPSSRWAEAARERLESLRAVTG